MKSTLGVSERRACRAIGQLRSTQRYESRPNPFKEQLRERVVALAEEYGRYGYRPVTDMLRMEGWEVGRDAVYTIWREEGLKVPQKQPKRARLWLTDGSCIRLRAQHRKHVWSYDFVHDRTHDGTPFRILNIIDEYSKECLATVVRRRFKAQDVILILAELFLEHGCPEHIRSDNGPEFVAKRLVKWLTTLEVGPLFIQPGSPWENGYVESFNGKMRYELLDGEIFHSLLEAKVIIEHWRRHYNTVRPPQQPRRTTAGATNNRTDAGRPCRMIKSIVDGSKTPGRSVLARVKSLKAILQITKKNVDRLAKAAKVSATWKLSFSEGYVVILDPASGSISDIIDISKVYLPEVARKKSLLRVLAVIAFI